MSYRWYGKKMKEQMLAETSRRINASAIVVHDHAKKLIGVEGTGSAIKTMTHSYGGRQRTVKKKGMVFGHAVSAPGEPPRKQTGRLQGSIAWEMVSKILARVGTNVKYGKWLERGTNRMKARPWLGRSLVEMGPKIKRLITAPMNLKGGP
jgi:hypothetical protein